MKQKGKRERKSLHVPFIQNHYFRCISSPGASLGPDRIVWPPVGSPPVVKRGHRIEYTPVQRRLIEYTPVQRRLIEYTPVQRRYQKKPDPREDHYLCKFIVECCVVDLG